MIDAWEINRKLDLEENRITPEEYEEMMSLKYWKIRQIINRITEEYGL